MIRALFVLALPLLAVSTVAGQEKAAPAKRNPSVNETASSESGAANKSTDEKPAVGRPKEEQVERFVEEHHKELRVLLKHLKKNRPKQYDRAIRELYTTSERLAGLKSRDGERYELELEAWKLKSRAQLLAARLVMRDEDELKQQLRSTLSDQYDVRRKLLELDQRRASQRAERLEQEIVALEARREANIQKDFERLTNLPSTKEPKGKGAKGSKP